MIGLVDYGLGNIRAFANIYRYLGVRAFEARTPSDIRAADALILPGVGAFDWAMTRLNESGLRDALDVAVVEAKKPILGICVGMQMMARTSEEGVLSGLGWLDGTVKRFSTGGLTDRTHLPHMGWNDATPVRASTLFEGMEAPRFYFLHSYFVQTNSEDSVLATSNYGIKFTSAVQLRNVYGTQFHPEKSHHWGVHLLKKFSELV